MNKKIIDWDGSRIEALNYIVNGQLKFEFEGVKFCIYCHGHGR